jgi:hypothetical protein
MTTEFIRKPVANHGNKLAHGLSAATLVFLYTTFAPKSDVARLDARADRIETKFAGQATKEDAANLSARCDRCDESRSAQWRHLMDIQVALARIGFTVPKPETKPQP